MSDAADIFSTEQLFLMASVHSQGTASRRVRASLVSSIVAVAVINLPSSVALCAEQYRRIR